MNKMKPFIFDAETENLRSYESKDTKKSDTLSRWNEIKCVFLLLNC